MTQPLLDGLQVSLRDAIRIALSGVSFMDGKRSVGSSILQAVLQHIARFPSRSCWESAATIAVITGKQTRTVESALRALAALGLIETTGPKTRRRHSIGPDQIARLKAMLDGTEPDKLSDSIQSEPDNSTLNCLVEPDNSALNCPVEPDTASGITEEENQEQQTTEIQPALALFERSKRGSRTVVVDFNFQKEKSADFWNIAPQAEDESDWNAVLKRLSDYQVRSAKTCIQEARRRNWAISRCNHLIDRATRENKPPSHLANWFLMEGSAPTGTSSSPGTTGFRPFRTLDTQGSIRRANAIQEGRAKGVPHDIIQETIIRIEDEELQRMDSSLNTY